MTRTRTRSGRTWSAVPLLVAVCLAAPASASAVQIGSGNVNSPATGLLPCTDSADSCIQTQDKIGGDSLVNVVPAGGRILTGFRIRQASGPVALRILRLSGGNFSRVGGTSDFEGEDPNGAAVHSLVTHVVVQPGDFIGLKLGPGASLGVIDGASDTNAFELSDAASPQLIDGAEPYELLLDATIEGDRDGDGLGDDSEDPDNGFPSTGGGDVNGGVTGKPVDPLAALRAGKRPGGKIVSSTRLKASKKGVVKLRISNPNGYRIRGTLTLRAGGLKLGSKAVSIAAGARSTVRVTLSKKARRRLARKRRLGAVAIATLRGPIGRSRTLTKKISIKAPPRPKKRKRGGRGGGGGGGGGGQLGGTYCPPKIVYDPDGYARSVPGYYAPGGFCF